jgi:hypothetical protein
MTHAPPVGLSKLGQVYTSLDCVVIGVNEIRMLWIEVVRLGNHDPKVLKLRGCDYLRAGPRSRTRLCRTKSCST